MRQGLRVPQVPQVLRVLRVLLAARLVSLPVRREKLQLRVAVPGRRADRAQPDSVGQARVELD